MISPFQQGKNDSSKSSGTDSGGNRKYQNTSEELLRNRSEKGVQKTQLFPFKTVQRKSSEENVREYINLLSSSLKIKRKNR